MKLRTIVTTLIAVGAAYMCCSPSAKSKVGSYISNPGQVVRDVKDSILENKTKDSDATSNTGWLRTEDPLKCNSPEEYWGASWDFKKYPLRNPDGSVNERNFKAYNKWDSHQRR